MELLDEFEVTLPLEDAWRVLTDLERVAPCLPGAQLDEVDGDEYRGQVRIKVGPITVAYKGVARFTGIDEQAHVAELHAEGRESRGQGAASANVRATLTEAEPGRTSVVVATSLEVSGRVAQFGRGALADVSARLMRQFVENLERDLNTDARTDAGSDADSDAKAPGAEAGEAAPTGDEAATTRLAPQSGPAAAEPAAPLSAVRLLGPVLLKRLLAPLALGAIAVFVRRLRSRRRA